jgi:hypothetical protein
MIYAFHPEAAAEYAEHTAFYKSLRSVLGIRFNEAVKAEITSICSMPARYRTELSPAIRRAKIQGFPYSLIFRESINGIQILALAHHRRRPFYWLDRV